VNIPQALVAFADPEQRRIIGAFLTQCGFYPVVVNSIREITAALAKQKLALIFCGSELPDGTFRDVLVEAHRTAAQIPVVVASRTGCWEEYFKALQQGAFDLIATPCRADEVRHIVDRLPRELTAA
jgi:DNA-binding NtrC family response regulator